MKRFFTLFILACSLPVVAFSQFTLDSCQKMARANYPQIKQYDLIRQSADYTLANAGKMYLPQISLSAQATYQSAVTHVNVTIPPNFPFDLKIPSPSKDQYQTVAQVSQLIWDGGAVKAQKEIAKASSDVDISKVDVDLYAINDRVNQLFFGILSLNEQLKQNDLLQNDLSTNADKITAYISGGVANQADLDNMTVEQLNVKQIRVQLKAVRKSFFDMLSALTGTTVNDQTVLVTPDVLLPATNLTNNRPELQLFDAQKRLLESQKSQINAANLPKISLFLQGGYGRPGLNMLDNSFSPFYIGGVRLSWNLSGLFYTQKNSLKIIDTSEKSVDAQRETFLFNTNLQQTQQHSEIEKFQELIKSDDEIITLRHNVKLSSEAKVANGTLSVSDLIRDINAESQAKQNKKLHEIQLLQAEYNLKYITNKL